MLPNSGIQKLATCLWLLTLPTLATLADFTPEEDGIYAVFDTSEGEVVTKLFYREAPISCANFVGLAEGDIPVWNQNGEAIQAPFYDGLTFHSAIAPGTEGYIPFLQGGDPQGDGTGGPGYTWPDEVQPQLTHEKAGTLSMANYGPNTNGSQFFFTLEDTLEIPPFFDGKHNVFGETIEGLDVLAAIANLPNSGEPFFLLDSPATINSVTIHRRGDEALAFDYAEHLFPHRTPAPAEAVAANANAPFLRIHAQAQSRYLVNASPDLQSWKNIATLAGPLDRAAPVDYDFASQLSGTSDSRYVRVSEIQGHKSENRAGARIVVTSSNGTYVETIELNEGQFAIYTVFDSSYQAEYEWYRLDSERDQLLVRLLETNASIPEIQFHLTWTSATGGSAYIRDATPDYDPDSVDDYVVQGTFTYQE
ncbi:peptidylprolyl isomerase [Pelagicoccus enzymogenes]|uniref:peptidylprolyl isomerase n=1 Tax=Pelagicoccus enzymogenes TaxID=2773457 RepID=UPI00280F3381|nr:peptidylprolyl isomerase [Pelagicoccus enzymogenes]MDQ8199106.1 peptidylprolyl isomerase [Pelagicoccus enzymogenes]